METRLVTQVKIYKLILNPMTNRAESRALAAIAYDKDKLEQWIESQLESWTDGQWRKAFRKGSPLEWFNPEFSNTFGHGVEEEWVNRESLDLFLSENKTPLIT